MQGECGRYKCLSAIWVVGAVILLCRNYWFGDGRLNLIFHGLVPSTTPPPSPQNPTTSALFSSSL